MARKLASVQVIKSISAIAMADSISVVEVLGWQVVVKNGEFNVGEMVVYCEVDSLMPDVPEFEFLKGRGMRIRTMRLRGQISQGICFPLSIVEGYGLLPEDMFEGQDVTEAMGVTQYIDELPPNLIGEAKGYMPVDIPKSDITRVQTLQPLLDKYAGTICYASEKLDGESLTNYVRDGGTFGVTSKELDFLDTPASMHWQVAREMGMEEKLRSVGRNISLQGEIVGEGIRGNKYNLKGKHVFFYNAFDIDTHSYYSYNDFMLLMSSLQLKHVPIVNDRLVLPSNIQELVKLSIGKSALRDTQREGIVVCPLREINDMIGRVIFKVISPDFLIKHNE